MMIFMQMVAAPVLRSKTYLSKYSYVIDLRRSFCHLESLIYNEKLFTSNATFCWLFKCMAIWFKQLFNVDIDNG